mgnify:CR=1 FL=1
MNEAFPILAVRAAAVADDLEFFIAVGAKGMYDTEMMVLVHCWFQAVDGRL